MRNKITLKAFFTTVGFLFLFISSSFSQTYSFMNYGTEKNIPNGFVYTMVQSDDGFLWIGTASGITRFDGYTFYNVQYPDSASGRIPTKSLKDKSGTLWFGCSDGALLYSKDNRLFSVPLGNTRSISELTLGPDGLIYVIPQGKAIYTVNPGKLSEIHQYALSVEPALFSATTTSSGDLLIGTQENILLCKPGKDSISVVKTIEDFDAGVTSIHSTSDPSLFIVGTDENGLFRLKISGNEASVSRIPGSGELNSLKVLSISADADGSFWVSTSGSGAVQLVLSNDLSSVKFIRNYDLNSGLPGNVVRDVFQDGEGNYWFGLYGEGISMLSSYALTYYSPGKKSEENNIIYIKNSEGNYLLGTPTGFHIFDPSTGKSVSFTNLTGKVGNAEIKSYFLDDNGNLWIGTGGEGLFVRNRSGAVKHIYKSGDNGADDIKDIEINSRNIWLATTNGVVVLDPDGHQVKTFDINNGLPHNSINKIFLWGTKFAYIGTESERLYKIDSLFNVSYENAPMTGSTRNKILSITRSSNGAIWVATDGNGFFRFKGDSLSSVTRSNNLISNYCYSILADRDGNIWIGHSKAFSRYNTRNGSVKVFGTDFAKLGLCNAGGIFESADKKIFIGTTEGLVVYDRTKEKKKPSPPFNNINIVEINDVPYPYQPSYVLPYKKYKIKVYYSGINFGDPDKVYYSTFLDNFDLDWSKPTTSREELFSLSDGKYKFSMVSVNEEGLSQKAPLTFTILIKKPFYRTWWFVIGATAFVLFIIVIIIRQRDKVQKRIQEYLETELAARTSVVMKQKGEIELQNIEITDSINYAKRIQSSILPDINKLKDTFEDAFIFFHPRDIVSGDFYWFDKLDEDKFILVCADSTGHGVPGAFMSMIGSTLLQDIVTRKRISKPSEILSLLDKQIFSTLNQNVELGVSNDGMDMVVCEFNTSTRHIRFASAMRPVILVLDGESFYIKGNRSSVGGESVVEKFFDDQEYYLKEGDTIYLFSDGLPDQFGGPDGKKLKIARLKRMIEQIAPLPMDAQKEAMTKFYFDWKGAYDQVDDVLLMGVKV